MDYRMSYRTFFDAVSRPYGRDSVLLLLRIWLGLMMVYHGSDKAFRSYELFALHISTFGIPLAKFISAFVIGTQFVGGFCVFFGLTTRVALVPVMIVVFSAVIESMFYLSYDPFSRKGELSLTYTVIALAIFIAGPGRYSIDEQLGKRRDAEFESIPHEQWHRS
jgi:putative oxidoreductase